MAAGQDLHPERAGKQGQGRLVAVVVTYNRLVQLQDTLDRLLQSDVQTVAAVVVADNASTDGTADWLATQGDARLHVLRSEVNDGGAGGFARGMAHAMTHCAPDWLVLMDDDGRPLCGGLETFHTLDLSAWDGIAAAVYFPDGQICEMNRPSRNPFWHGRVFLRSLVQLGGRSGFHLDPGHYGGTEPVSIDVTSFVGFFVRADVVAQAGYPDPRLFVYGDDGLYTLGLRQAGRRLAFHPQVRFEHALSTFEGQRGRFRPVWKVYYYHRNLLLLYRQAAGWMFWPLMALILPKWALKGRDHAGERRVFYRLLTAAIGDGIRRRLGRSLDDVKALSER